MVLTVFAVKYTYFKPQNILINPQNILMISYTYRAKFCRTTPECLIITFHRFDSLATVLSPSIGLGFVTGPKPLIERIVLHMQVCR